ncbi:HU family DNA-binding protein [Mycolicibacter longobardus]|uniref:HU family DNA-binding protein n=1 Tax=Mycolicibacter longobardus TaxID=1108812 RepID=UPI0021F32449|nr:HU family DNA-binding protein [Mycolicibacter longobardus]MCV7384034.1 HU family DNA-binding protein [Mycolicibacter longobardus]
MNKAELIEVLTKELDTDRRSATEAVEHFVNAIVRAVHKGESVTITGFGVFERRRRAARVARNPRTGETVKVKPTSVPAFRPGAQFKAIVSGAQRVPSEGLAVKRGAGAAAAKPAKKSAAKKATKAAAKKSPAKKATKAAVKKAPAKKVVAKKAATKAPAKKVVAKKAATKAPAKKVTAKKTATKAPVRKAATKAPAKKVVAKKAATKAVAKKAPAKKATKATARKGRK